MYICIYYVDHFIIPVSTPVIVRLQLVTGRARAKVMVVDEILTGAHSYSRGVVTNSVFRFQGVLLLESHFQLYLDSSTTCTTCLR